MQLETLVCRFAQCPECGKYSLVQRGGDRFRCLSCKFEVNLAEPEPKPEPPGILRLLVMVVVMYWTLALLGLMPTPEAGPNRHTPTELDLPERIVDPGSVG